MSWRHGLAAGLVDLKDPVAKAVLNALAFHANEWSGQCWPSIARLTTFTGLSERSVQNGLRRLEELGLLATRIGGNKRASVYLLTLSEVEPIDQGAPPAPHGAPAAPHPAPPAPQSSMKDQGKDSPPKLTPDWQPSTELLAWAGKELPDADVSVEVGRFVAVNLASEKEIKNVEHAFRAWILRGKQFERGRPSRVDPGQLGSGVDRLRARAAGGVAGS